MKVAFKKALQVTSASLVGVALLAGCESDRPHEYGESRPDVTSITPDDAGVQGKDLVEATDQMAMDLLKLPELNDSREQWTIVATGMENDTTNRRKSYDIFINRLKTLLAQQGHGRVQLVERRDAYRYLQSRELEPAGDAHTPPGPAGVQPQFALNGSVEELPNLATSLFRFEFKLTDLRNRTIPWVKDYMVKVER